MGTTAKRGASAGGLWALAAWMWAAAAAHGGELGELYRVERPAMQQDARTRERVTREALLELVQRLSGRPADSAGNAALAAGLERASSLVQAFGFREPSFEERAQSSAQYVLQLDFEPQAVLGLLKDAGLPAWGRERPDTLLWLVLPAETQETPALPDGTTPGQPAGRFLTEAGDPVLLRGLRDAARRRGLPLALPSYDAVDAQALAPADVQAALLDQVEAASLRYEAEAVLSGELRQEAGGWSGHFALQLGAEPEAWDVQGANREEVLVLALDGLGERLARQYAVQHDAQAGIWRLRISNVRDLGDYTQVLRYLRALSLVKQLEVSGVEGSVLLLQLGTSGDAAALRQALSLGKRLQPLTGVAEAEGSMSYQWMP